jgi:aryl-alcohol dehydrogenase-like predicted oxidoreductase
MESRTFGRTGLRLSVLGFGGAPIGLLNTDRERTANILNFLLDQGINFIDTAAGYEGSEELIGQTVSHRREQFILLSKCGRKLDGLEGADWSSRLIANTIDRSLKRLRTDRLDVMILHSCDLEVLQRGEAIAALAKARDAGKIRFAGYSGDNDDAAYAATLADVAVIETSINVADQANITRVLPVARQHNVGVVAKRPIANAAWKAIDRQPGFYRDYAAAYTQRLKKLDITPADVGFVGNGASGDPEQDWPELALRFTLSFPEVHTAIIGTTNPANAQKNLEYARKGPLPADVVARIRAAFQHADPVGAWEGLT